ncbi:GHMP kinase [uncultured Megasphaera sp.]|uniref:GHMP family kinase ATP-binding protein n=1 Tax=uncultured Megasphaera sp. TaxID=165188 RepID=UPI00258B98F9|nr:GHMP kinase [uncultured Megasphaera sp.]
MHLSVSVPGSCGEFIQGRWHGTPFLLTCPIDLYSTATVHEGEQGPLQPKAKAALAATLAYLGQPAFPYSLSIQSQLPPGKGMASSTADIAAVSVAVATALGKTLSAAEIGHLAATIDAVDGVFAHGLALVNYSTGDILRTYGPVPPMKIAILDAGGIVQTEDFHAATDRLVPAHTEAAAQALASLKDKVTAETLGKAATRSAVAHQPYLPKPDLEQLIRLAKQHGALGVNTAHSGTICGILFPADRREADIEETAKTIAGTLGTYTYYRTVRLISGGVRIQKEGIHATL